MELVLKDRVRETTTVLGTNDATLLGAVTGYQSFAVIGNANTCYYTIADNSGNWEVGIGTYSTSGPTLARTTVVSSSNSNAKVSFPAGTKDIFVTYPAGYAAYVDGSNIVPGTAATLPTTYGGTGLSSYTAGDLPYYASGTALTKLTIGANGRILKSNGSAPVWDVVSNVAVTTFSGGTTGLTPASATAGAVTLAGTLIAGNGGTGQSSYAVGDLLYASTTTALSKLADVATGNALISGGVGVAPAYGKIGLTTHVSGTLPIANGGTNSTATPTNGGVAYGTGSAFAFNSAGTSGQILRSNGAAAPTWVNLSTLGVSTISFGSTGLTPATATSGAVSVAGTLITSNGGTGVSSYTAGDTTYYASGTALTKLGIGAANSVYTSSGTAPQWSTSLNLSGSITVAGNVGIGGTTTNARLKVFTTTDGDGILLDQNGTTRLSLTADTTNLSAKISSGNVFLDLESSNASSRGIRFFTGSTSTERMRIDSAGGVSFGQRAPYANAYNPTYGYLQTYGFALQCYSGYNVASLTTNGYVNGSGQVVSYGAATGAQYVQDNARHRFLTFTATDASQVQAPVESVRIDADGLKFNGDSAAENALDDYEEGTFTPVLRGTTSGTANGGGYYTKIGRTVQVQLAFSFALAAGTIAGNLYITGLPFAALGSSTLAGQYGTGLLHIRGATTSGTGGAPIAIINGTQVNLHTSANLGTTTVIQSATATFPATGIVQNGVTTVQINWTFTYQV